MNDIARLYPADSEIEKSARAAALNIEICWKLIDEQFEQRRLALLSSVE